MYLVASIIKYGLFMNKSHLFSRGGGSTLITVPTCQQSVKASIETDIKSFTLGPTEHLSWSHYLKISKDHFLLIEIRWI